MERPEPGAGEAPDQLERWGIAEAVEYVLSRAYKRVTLQFPDEMLQEAPEVARGLQEELRACTDAKVKWWIMGGCCCRGP
jgi:diphthamide biosynthesis enzyme Dph1/Dph2-like protein